MSRFYKIGVPILIVLSMLAVVGTGIALAKGPDTAVSPQPAVYDGSSAGTCPGGCNISGCWNGGGYCSGPCGRGGWNEDNSGGFPPCHGY